MDEKVYSNVTQLRVRYSETDQMGYVYYGNYAQFFEVGRVEAMRGLGMSYRDLEEQGIMLPVLDYKTKYIKPAKYDDLLTIKTIIRELPEVRIRFEYEVYNEKEELLNKGETTLVFIDMKTNRPRRAPQPMIEALSKHLS